MTKSVKKKGKDKTPKVQGQVDAATEVTDEVVSAVVPVELSEESATLAVDAVLEGFVAEELTDEGDESIGISLDETLLKSVLESLVFVSDKPVSEQALAKAARAPREQVRALLGELVESYRNRGVELVEVAGGYTFRSNPANAEFVREFVGKKPTKLARSQLETLAIIAYRQPITRPEIDEIRGVDSSAGLKMLLERDFVRIIGRKEEPGRPLLYGTTARFLQIFGLKQLKDLPTLREFTELNEESRALFARRTGESSEDLSFDAAAVEQSEIQEMFAEDDDNTGEASSEGDALETPYPQDALESASAS